jgi:hypothetical protein
MSNCPVPLSLVKVLEPRVDIAESKSERQYAILSGADYVNFQPITATSSSNNSFVFKVTLSEDTIIDRKMYVQGQFQVTMTGSTADASALGQLGTFDAPRAFPLAQITDTLTAQINGQNFNINPRDVVNVMSRYGSFDRDTRDKDYSMTPTKLDESYLYTDPQVAATPRDPLRGYGNNPYEVCRGGFAGITQVSNTSNQAVWTVTFCEPLFISPLYYGKEDAPGLFGVRQLGIQMNFMSNLQRVWSHSTGNDGVAPSNRVVQLPLTINMVSMTPQLLMCVLKPKVTHIPKSLLAYPYYQVDRLNAQVTPNPVPAGTAFSVLFPASMLQTIPKRAYIACRISDAAQDCTTTDSYAVITGINVTFNSVSGILSGATQQDLYRMSVENGCNMSWTQWSKKVGAPLCIEFGKDIGLGDIYAPGVSGNFNFQFTAQFVNPSTAAVNYTCYLIIVSEGTMTINNATVQSTIGVISPTDVLNSQEKNFPTVKYSSLENMHGGSFFSSIGSFFKDKVIPIVKDVRRGAEALADTGLLGKFTAPIKSATEIAKSLGAGYIGSESGARYGGEINMQPRAAPKQRRKKLQLV